MLIPRIRISRFRSGWWLSFFVFLPLIISGCGQGNDHGSPYSQHPTQNGSGGESHFLPLSFFKEGIADRFQFDSGFTLAGSQPQLNYVNLLTGQLRNSCATGVKKIPYEVTGWYPKSASLALNANGSQTEIPVLDAVPYSEVTADNGVTAPVIELPKLTANAPTDKLDNEIILDGKPLAKAISSYDVKGKIVVVPLPRSYINLEKVDEKAPYINDLDHHIPKKLDHTFLAGLIAMQHVEAVLKGAGAAGIVAILPGSIPGKLYAPYQGTVQGIPAVYLKYETADQVTNLVEKGGKNSTATLAVNANVVKHAQDYNITGVVPGPSDREIIIASHTDGFNVVEENGAVAIMGLVKHFCSLDKSKRPATLRIVITGSHHAGNIGIQKYIKNHKSLIEKHVVAAIEIEHLAARAVKPAANGRYEPAGYNEPYIAAISSLDSKPLVSAATAWSKKIDVSTVGPPSTLGFGAGGSFWAEVTNAVQLVSGPSYLLSYDVPDHAIANQFVDYSLIRKQTEATAQMIVDLASSSLKSSDNQ